MAEFEITRVWRHSSEPDFVHFMIRSQRMPERHLREPVHSALGRYLAAGISPLAGVPELRHAAPAPLVDSYPVLPPPTGVTLVPVSCPPPAMDPNG